MKVVLDLSALLAENLIDEDEYRRLAALASSTVRRLALNVLLFFGIAMLCAGAVWLVPESRRAAAAIGAGFVVAAGALAGGRRAGGRLQAACEMLLPAGVTLAVLGILHQDADVPGFLSLALDALAAAATCLFFAVAGGSVLLTIAGTLLANLAVFTFARHWQLPGIEPTTVLLLGSALQALALAALWRQLAPGLRRQLTAAAAITALIIVNLCFIDRSLVAPADGQWPTTANNVHALIWTGVLAAGGWLAYASSRRWAVGMVALFVLIHFCGQWLKRFDASALSLFVVGLAFLALAGMVSMFNRRADARGGQQP